MRDQDGHDKSLRRQKCPECKGKGVLPDDDPDTDDGWRNCDLCGGMGEIYRDIG